jgi:hypothetical protein
MAGAEDYANWIVKNEALKGTPQFNTVAEAYKEAKASESLTAGQAENYGESVLYEKPESEKVGTGRKLAQSAGKGVTGVFDMILGAPENVKRIYQYATTEGMPVPRPAAPLQTYLTEKGVFKPEAEFNTPIGNVAGFTTEMMAGGGFNPKTAATSLIKKPMREASMDIAAQFGRSTLQGGVGGTTSEVLKEAGIESPVAQFLATGGAMGVAGAPTAMRSTGADLVNKSLKNVTPEQLKMADILMKKSYSVGSPITGAEAIAQVTGGNSLTGVQRVVENSTAGAPAMESFMAGRPEANRQAFGQTMQGVSPSAPTSRTPINLEQTAGKLIKGAESSLTANVDPYFKEAGKQAVPNTDIAGMMQNPKIADAVQAVRSSGKYGLKNEPANSIKTLIAAKQFLDDEFNTQTNPVTGAEKNAARVTWSANRQLDDFLNNVSPDYAKGSSKFEVAQKTQFAPLKEGVVGQLAEGANPAQTLMPPKPVSLYPEDIKRTAELLRRKDPKALPEWTRQNLESIFNETTQNLVGGENQFGGAKFASTIQGNKQQKDNLRTLVTESAGMQAYQGFENLMDVLEAQGKREAAGSKTAYNQMIQEQMQGGGIGNIPTTVFKPSKIANMWDQFRFGQNAEMLSKLLTDPDSVEKLKELSRTKPSSAKSQVIVNSLVGGYTATKPEITEESK